MSRPEEPTVELETARSRLLAEAEVLAGVVERLHGLAESLPVPEDDATPAAEISNDVPSFMAGAALCTADDSLRPAIAQLRRAAAVTREELQQIAAPDALG